jgi:hypothetical protein
VYVTFVVVALELIKVSLIDPEPLLPLGDTFATVALVQVNVGVGVFVELEGVNVNGVLLQIAEGVRLLDNTGVGFTLTEMVS